MKLMAGAALFLFASMAFILSTGSAESSCLGAAAFDQNNSCPKFSTSFTPSSKAATSVAKGVYRNRNLCRGPLRRLSGVPSVCLLGSATPQRSIALIGDSHAAQWRPAIADLAGRHNWRVYSATASVCDYNILVRVRASGKKRAACTRFRRAIPRLLQDNPQIDTVIFTHVNRAEKGGQASYRAAYSALPPSVKHIVTIRDNPRTLSDLHGCLTQRLPRQCSVARNKAIYPDLAGKAARAIGGTSIDLSNYFCDRQRCYPVVGRLLVYGDGNHQTSQFNRTLAPYLDEPLLRAMAN